MAYPFDAVTFGDAKGALARAVPEYLARELVDNIMLVANTLRAFEVRGGIRDRIGGWPLKVPILYQLEGALLVQNALSDVINPGAGDFKKLDDGSNVTNAIQLGADDVIAAQYDAVEVIVRQGIAFKDVKQRLLNDRSALADFVQGLIRAKIEALAYSINNALWRLNPGDPSPTVAGSIPYFVNSPLYGSDGKTFDATLLPANAYYYTGGSGTAPGSQTIGGITRSKGRNATDHLWWNVPYASATNVTQGIGNLGISDNVYGGNNTVLTSQLVSQVYTNIVAGSGKAPNLIVTTPALMSALNDQAIGAQRWVNKSGAVNIGMWATAFNDAVLISDAKVPPGTVYFLNLDDLYLVSDYKGIHIEEVPVARPVQVFMGTFHIQLVLQNAKSQGFMTGMIA